MSKGSGRATTRVPSPLSPTPVPTIYGQSVTYAIGSEMGGKALYVLLGGKIREVSSAEAGKIVVKKEMLIYSLEVLWQRLLSARPYRWMGL